MLAGRELSESQVRARLKRRGHAPDAIDDAVLRLVNERALDDARAAEALARDEAVRKRRGRYRIAARLSAAGVPDDVAERAVDRVLETVDEDQLVEAALERRLRNNRIADQAEFARLYRYLVGQGFEADRVMATLNRRRR